MLYLTFVSSFTLCSFFCMKRDLLEEKNTEKIKESMESYHKTLGLSLFNIYVSSAPVFLLIHIFYDPGYFHLIYSPIKFVIALYNSSLFFWITHKYFHTNKQLLKYHIVHHENKIPFGIQAAYTHPFDFVFGNMLPLGLPIFLWNCDTLTAMAIMIFQIYTTVVVDHNKNNGNSDHHILHHKYANCNYGTSMIDSFMGTLRKKET
jgi:sterol desaturase/sphingolipid hydroxylase (fatty acid hydroxylase superfamily)